MHPMLTREAEGRPLVGNLHPRRRLAKATPSLAPRATPARPTRQITAKIDFFRPVPTSACPASEAKAASLAVRPAPAAWDAGR